MTKYDMILIGSGQATGTIIPKLVDKGLTIAIAEGGAFGGTCVNYGCSPTKTIVASARAAHMARRGADFGVITGDIDINFDKVVERQRKIRDEWSSGLKNWLSGLDNVTIYDDYAKFVTPHSVRVGDEVIEADKILIHTGARARVLDIPGLDEVDWLDNKGILNLTDLPEHLIIAGGSYIGLEFGQAFQRLGTQVTVIEYGGQLTHREDVDIAEAALDIMRKGGTTIHLNSELQRVAKTGDGGVEVFFNGESGETSVKGVASAAGSRAYPELG